MFKPRIDIYSHSIRVSQFDERVREALKRYIGYHLSEWANKWDYKNRRNTRYIKCSYVGAHANRRVLYFHKSQYLDVINAFKSCGYMEHQLEIVERPFYTPDTVEYTKNPDDSRTPRDYQELILDYLTSPCPSHVPPAKLLTLQTGAGKSFCVLQALMKMQVRALFLIKPAYIERWKEEFENTLILNKGELLIIQGSKDLRNLLEMEDQERNRIKIIVISISTYRNYLKHWEDTSGEGYGEYRINPIHLCEHFKIGVKIVDESHQEFHLIYRSELFNHVPLSISMSATMESDQNFLNKMYEATWPIGHRAPRIAAKKYILVRNVWYGINPQVNVDRFKTHMGYSHVKLEQWIAAYDKRLLSFYAMVLDLLNKTYIQDYQTGQKAVVFCATQDMCTGLTKYLNNHLPDKNVKRYIQGDSYQENLIESDITVTTLKSAGTAVDVPNLKICICTVAVSSVQANLQAIGRLRELKNWPDINPEFYFLSCKQIDKHRQYEREKAHKVHERVLRYEQYNASYQVL